MECARQSDTHIWDCSSRTYNIATTQWRRLLPGRKVRERELDRKRDRSSRTRPADDNERRQQRRVSARRL